MFDLYFRRKIIICVIIGIATIGIRILSGHQTSVTLILSIILGSVICAVILGYLDYNFYERSYHNINSSLLDRSPLLEFQNRGFSKQENSMLEGQINNYSITLAPVANIDREKVLVILIPLQIKEGLEKYFLKYNDKFKLNFSNEILMAEAMLKNYQREYDFRKLWELIETTTLSLKKNEIEPLKIYG